MIDALLAPIEALMTSGWVYAVLLGVCALDALIPVIPGEAPVILGGVYAASDPHGPNIFLVVLASAAGAAIGDHLCYAVGHGLLGQKVLNATGRRGRLVQQVREILHTRGTWALLVVRFIPGGRSIATVSLGATHYPLLRKFTPYDLLATTIWAIHGALIGYIGGRAFADNPLAGIATGLALGIVVAAVLEWRQRSRTKVS